METLSLPVLAGMVSTTVFASSMLPMLLKAARTRDLSSYSIGNLVLANIGNAVHSVYVFHLPPGPIWFLHGFYLLTTALMLCWWVRYRPGTRGRADDGKPTSAAAAESASAAPGDPRRRLLRPLVRAPGSHPFEQIAGTVATSPRLVTVVAGGLNADAVGPRAPATPRRALEAATISRPESTPIQRHRS